MTMQSLVCLALAWSLGLGAAQAQTGPTPVAAADDEGPGLWIAAGGGGALARGHCGTCDRTGVFFRSPGLLLDAGIQINRRADAGIEVAFVSSRIEDLDPIRTTFVLGVGQFRPWVERGLSLRGGMGVGFVGNGIHNFNFVPPDLEPPFTTNAVALVMGIGWEFLRQGRYTLQVLGTHHVTALGELTTSTGTVKNVVGNYWLVGGQLVIR